VSTLTGRHATAHREPDPDPHFWPRTRGTPGGGGSGRPRGSGWETPRHKRSHSRFGLYSARAHAWCAGNTRRLRSARHISSSVRPDAHYNGIATRSVRRSDGGCAGKKRPRPRRPEAQERKRAPGPPVVGSPPVVCVAAGVGDVTPLATGLQWCSGANVLSALSAHHVAAEDLEDRGGQITRLRIAAGPRPGGRREARAD